MMTGRQRSNKKHQSEEEEAPMRIPASPMRRVFAAAPPVVKYKKAPQAPKRFKKIRSELEQQAGDHEQRQSKINTTEVAKMVSKAWKEMPDDEREKWEEIARLDKERYEREKLVYTGPWKVPILPKKTKKRAAALLRQQRHDQHETEEVVLLPPPQPPLSAFLMFAQTKRAALPRHDEDDDDDEEEGHELARLWQDCDPVEKNNYIDTEFVLREQYEHALRAWQKQQQRQLEQQQTNNPDYESVGSTTSSTTTNTSLYSTKMAEAIFEYRPPKNRSEKASASAAAAARTKETGYPAAPATYHGASSSAAAPPARSNGTTTTTYPAPYYHPSTTTTTTTTMMHGYTHPAYREYHSRGGPAEYSNYGSSDGGAEQHPEYQQQHPQQHPYYSQYPHYSQYPASSPYGGGNGYGYGYARPPLPPTATVVTSSSSSLPFQPLATASVPPVLYHYPPNSQLHAGSGNETQPPSSPAQQQQHSSSHGDERNP